MIFDCIGNPYFKRDQILMIVLYHCRMASKRQIALITGWTEKEVEWSLYRIRDTYEQPSKALITLLNEKKERKKQGKSLSSEKEHELKLLRQELKEKRDSWIRTFRLPGGLQDKSVLALGKSGLRYASELLEETLYSKEAPDSQVGHTHGSVDILARVMEKDPNAAKSWYFEYETIDYLSHLYERRGKELNTKTCILPDAWARILDQQFWFEFDNGSEGQRKLENKMHEYVVLLDQIKVKNQKIVWVTTNPNRCEYLEKVWRATKKRFSNNFLIPEMKFFVAGKEIPYLLDPEVENIPN